MQCLFPSKCVWCLIFLVLSKIKKRTNNWQKIGNRYVGTMKLAKKQTKIGWPTLNLGSTWRKQRRQWFNRSWQCAAHCGGDGAIRVLFVVPLSTNCCNYQLACLHKWGGGEEGRGDTVMVFVVSLKCLFPLPQHWAALELRGHLE